MTFFDILVRSVQATDTLLQHVHVQLSSVLSSSSSKYFLSTHNNFECKRLLAMDTGAR